MKHLFVLLLLPCFLCGQTWSQLSDFPGPERDDGVAVNVNNKLYFGSGLSNGFAYTRDFYELNPSTNVWSAIASLPWGAQRQYACIFPAAGSFYVFGGDGVGGPLNNLYAYTISNNSWTQMASKPGNGVFGANCLEFGDKIIIVGGKSQGNAAPINEVWEYTISTNTWNQKNNFPFGGRFRSSSAVIDNTGYLIFGFDNNNNWRRDMFKYNQSTDTWTKILDFPQTPGRAYATLKAIDDKLILFGGYDSLNTYHKDVWYFDPANVSWTQKQDFPSFGRKGGMSAVAGNKFYYSCGINVSDTRLKETWAFDLPLGIREQTNNFLFSIYPNPTNEVLNIRLNYSGSTKLNYIITDVCGKEVLNVNTIEKQLSIKDVLPGIYFLKLFDGKTLLGTKRIIKE